MLLTEFCSVSYLSNFVYIFFYIENSICDFDSCFICLTAGRNIVGLGWTHKSNWHYAVSTMGEDLCRE